jgi:ribosome biogenesis protein MAK21
MAKNARPITAKATSTNTIPVGKGKSKGKDVKEQLRQAVMELGGDEEDLELIEGVDEDDESAQTPAKGKGKGLQTDEVSFNGHGGSYS